MTRSLYEAVGGAPAVTALAAAHHARCLADDQLDHPFSRVEDHDRHVARLAAYWGEAFGGPAAYSGGLGSQREVVEMHCVGGEDLSELGRRFLACFVAAMDDAALPDDPALREALTGYMSWSVRQFTVPGVDRPAGQGVPRWSWDGLQA